MSKQVTRDEVQKEWLGNWDTSYMWIKGRKVADHIVDKINALLAERDAEIAKLEAEQDKLILNIQRLKERIEDLRNGD